MPRSTLRLEYQPNVIQAREKPELGNEARGKTSSPRAKSNLPRDAGKQQIAINTSWAVLILGNFMYGTSNRESGFRATGKMPE